MALYHDQNSFARQMELSFHEEALLVMMDPHIVHMRGAAQKQNPPQHTAAYSINIASN